MRIARIRTYRGATYLRNMLASVLFFVEPISFSAQELVRSAPVTLVELRTVVLIAEVLARPSLRTMRVSVELVPSREAAPQARLLGIRAERQGCQR